MKKFQDGCYDTTKGIALIAKVLAGQGTMNYTRAAVGKGNLTDDQDPKTMETPADYVMDAKITAVTTPVDGECQITVQISSKDVSEGFYCTGIVLYAEDPDDGDVPFTYMVLENEPEWIRPSSDILGKLATFDIIAAVGAVDKVTAIVDPMGIATVENVQTMIAFHNESKTAHPDLHDHLKNTENPHDVTKDQVGLGNVPNVSTNDQTPTFTQAGSRSNITSGEKLSSMLGKIAKWFADMKTVAFSGKYSDLTGTPTIPEAATDTPKGPGTASAGKGTTWARADHVHPSQSSVTGSSGSCTGNAASATKVGHSLKFTGGISGSYNGSSDVSIEIPKIVTGLLSIIPPNTNQNTESVEFAKAFSSRPRVFLQYAGGAMSNVLLAVTNVTTTGFDLIYRRSDIASAIGIQWIAVAGME